MKNRYLKLLCVASLSACSILYTNAQSPEAPVNPQAIVTGTKVELSWSRTVMGQTLISNDFEGDSFPGDGWSTQVTNATDYKCSWFQYPTDEIKENLEAWSDLSFNGEYTAVVMTDNGGHEESYVQDEWLISPIVPGAAYLDFYCYVHPMILEYGSYDDFPDHYYVKVSKDGGATWDVVWDARYDASPSDEWQQVSVPLGEYSENTMIAFEAKGDQNEAHNDPLYFSWAIDDITISNSEAASVAARERMKNKNRADISCLRNYREFTSSQTSVAKAPAKALTTGYYNIYLDGKRIATKIKSLSYIDTSDKSVGTHVYKITYYDLANRTETDGVEISVNIEEVPFNSPKNLKISYAYEEAEGGYTTYISWEAPDGDRQPAYYNLYRDGSQLTYEYAEMDFSQTMMPKGVYVYEVTAVYEFPSGESAPISDIIAVDTRYPVMNLKHVVEGNDISLSWDAPKAEEGQTLTAYHVYRGNVCLIDNLTDTKFTDVNAPQGIYDYSVIAVYQSGEKSIRQFVHIENGEPQVYTLPLSENFDNEMPPADWTIVSENETRNNYCWRFDNFYGIPFAGNIDSDFASINSLQAGFTNIDCELRTPQFSTELKEDEYLHVDFDLIYLSKSGTETEINCSKDGGQTWASVSILPSYKPAELAEGEKCKVVHLSYDLTDFVTSSSMMLRWHYHAIRDGYMAVDNVKIYVNDQAGISDVTIDNTDATVEYFNLQGIRIENPSNGIYIRRQGSSVTKVIK